MTDKLRARAEELAAKAAYLYMTSREPVDLPDLIKTTVLTGMREALREEPDDDMIKAAAHVAAHGGGSGDIWNAANEARARGLE